MKSHINFIESQLTRVVFYSEVENCKHAKNTYIKACYACFRATTHHCIGCYEEAVRSISEVEFVLDTCRDCARGDL